MSKRYGLLLIGFGTVAQGLVELIQKRGTHIQQHYGAEFVITGVCDLKRGTLYDAKGLDLQALLELSSADDFSGYKDDQAYLGHKEPLDCIREFDADVVAEMTFTDIKTGGPAVSHCEAAFETGKHVITTNKGPVAVDYHRLQQMAHHNGCLWGIEGAVMSGTPVLGTIQQQLQGSTIRSIKGLLNGTTNYILTQMEQGIEYQAALADAQQKGYAEADPTADVEGKDVLAKVVILANVLLGGQLTVDQVACEGIQNISLEDVQNAQNNEQVWKLIGEVTTDNHSVSATVSPQQLDNTHPLAGIKGATNAVTVNTDELGDVTIMGPGAGKVETGYALLADLMMIHRHGGEVV